MIKINEITLYSYRYIGGGKNEQVFITINCKNKTFETNINQGKMKHRRCGFSCFELKNYSEFQELKRCLKYKGFKEKELE